MNPKPCTSRKLIGRVAIVMVAVCLSACADFSQRSFSGEPSPALVRQKLSQAYEQMVQKDDAAAERTLLDARRLEPTNPWIALNLGSIYQRRGQFGMARAEYRKALASQASDMPTVTVSNPLLNGAGFKKIAQHNLDSLEKVAGQSSGTTAWSMPEFALQKKAQRGSGVLPSADDADTKAVQLAIDSWSGAWAARDIDTYLKCYDRNFHGTKSDRKAWEAWRSKQIKATIGRIDLQIQEMRIVVQGAEAQVRFKQTYSADNYGDTGIKELSLVRAGGRWLINKETFTPVIQ